MSSVDNRVVQMGFDNKKFEQNVSSTMSLMDKLKAKLNFKGAGSGIEGVQKSFAKFSMGGIGAGVDAIKAKFSALSVVGVAAIANITNRAVDAGLKIAKAFSTDGITGGLKEYETNLNSIQTVLANTSSKGTTLDQVNTALQELNTYSDKTIYNFSEMAKNIGTFTAAGVDLDSATAAIKGIANLAAVSGSTSEQASGAMYQLSQAMSAGVLTLEDWNSVTNAGMGGEVFKKALIDTARVSGVAIDSIIKDQGSFRSSLEKKWLTSDILSDTLSKFTGDLTDAQLKAMGYTQEEVKGIIAMGKTATDAATKVKTMTQLWDTLQEGVGSGWSQSWQIVLGDFEEAKSLFTDISNSLGGIIGEGADARNKMLQGWKDLGGRQALIDSFWATLKILTNVTKAFSSAFRSVFPKNTAKDWYNITVNIKNFLERVAKGTGNLKTFKTIVKAVFSAFSVGLGFVKAFAGFLKRLFDVISAGSGGAVTQFITKIAKWVIGLDKAVKKGDIFVKFFDVLFDKIMEFSGYIQVAIAKIKEIMGAVDFGDVGDKVKEIVQKVRNGSISLDDAKDLMRKAWAAIVSIFQSARLQLGDVADGFQSVMDKIVAGFEYVKDKLEPVTSFIGGILSDFKEAFKNAFSGFSSGQVGAGGAVLALSGIIYGLIALVKKFIKEVKDFGIQDLANEIGETFGALGGHLNALTANVKAKSLLTLAAAIALLALSVVALAGVDPQDLTKSLTAIAVGFGQLLIAMGILTKMAGTGGFAKIPFIAASMILLAGAILILGVAVKKLSGMSWEELQKGLGAVTVLLGVLSGAIKIISGSTGGLLRAGMAMILISTALLILASAVKSFATMKWGELGKGMAGVATGLTVMTGALRAMPKNTLANSVALIAMAAALKILYSAVRSFSTLSWDEMGKGMAGVAAALLLIAGAMQIMPPNMMAQSLALIAVGAALQLISLAIASMSTMSWEEIARGMVALGGSMLILGGGLKFMQGSAGGAAALVLVSGALSILIPVLLALGKAPWQVIALGLGALAVSFGVIGVAGLLLKPVTPALLLFGAALLAVGAGMSLFGVGAIALAKAFEILVKTGDAGVKTIMAILDGLIQKLPQIVTAVGQSVIAFAKVIGDGAPVIIGAFTSIFLEMLSAVQRLSPQIMSTIGTLLSDLLRTIREKFPEIVKTGADLLMSLLKGIDDNIYDVTTTVVSIVVKFIKGFTDKLPDIIQAGWDLIIGLVQGISDSIENNLQTLIDAGLDLAGNLIEGIVNGLLSLGSKILDTLMGIIGNVWDNILGFFGIHSPSRKMFWVGEMMMKGWSGGIADNGDRAVKESERTSKNVFDALSNTFKDAPNLLDGMLETDPTIRPVLDLSAVQTEASKLSKIMATDALNASGTFDRALNVSAQEEKNNDIRNKEAAAAPVSLNFEQNITAPKAVNAAEIYRNTKGQLASAKEAFDRS